MIEKVFLDLDDTLNTFTLPALRSFGIDIGDYDYHRFDPDTGYDIVRQCSVLGGPKLTPAEFWTQLPKHLWATAPKSQEFDQILSFARRFGDENVFISTSPTLCPESCSGKLKWIQTNMPTSMQRNFFIGPHKKVIARPGYLLIDDSGSHHDNWVASGGKAILVPRPWNRMNGRDTAEYLDYMFQYY